MTQLRIGFEPECRDCLCTVCEVPFCRRSCINCATIYAAHPIKKCNELIIKEEEYK